MFKVKFVGIDRWGPERVQKVEFRVKTTFNDASFCADINEINSAIEELTKMRTKLVKVDRTSR